MLSLLLAGILISQTVIGTVPVNAAEQEAQIKMEVEEDQTETEMKVPEDWIEIKDASYFPERSSLETNVLRASAVTATKGHHVEYHSYEHENKLIGYTSGYGSQCASDCEYGAAEGTLGYERWIYGFQCIEDGGDWTAWTFTIYTHSGTNFEHKWSEIWIASGSGWLVAAGDAAVNNAAADRESYLKGDGAKCSCPGYLVVNTYNMVYDSNGGNGSIGSGTAEYNTTYMVSSEQFYRTGYTFNGYYIRRKSDGKVWGGSTNGWLAEKSTNESKYKIYQRGKKVTVGNSLVSEDVSLTTDIFTFVATWEKNTYTIEYNKNGAASGSMDSKSVKYGEKFTLAENKFAKKGYTFQGYYVKRDSDAKWYCGSTNKWQSSADITTNSYTKTLFKDISKERTMNKTWVRSDYGADTFTFYAVWEANSYTVTYNANGNVKGTMKGTTDSTTTVEVVYGKTISLSKKAVPDDNYYTFIGWSKSKSGELLSSLKMGVKDVTLYAVYSPPVSDIKEVYLLLADKTGKLSKNGKAAERCCSLVKAGNVSSPVKGYKYELEKINYKKLFQQLFPNSTTKNIVKSLVAVDHAGNSTQIPLDDVMIELPVSYNQTVKHLFQNLDTDEYEDIGDYIVNPGTAKEEVRKTTIEEFVEAGRSYTPNVLTEPLPEGYRFNSANSTAFNREKGTDTDIGKEYKVTETKITYACYDAVPYTLTFDPNGGSISAGGILSKNVYTGKVYDYLPGNEHTGFPNVTRNGYTLKGWYKSKVDATAETRVYPTTLYALTENSTIYAQWEVNSYKVTYDYWTNGGTAAWKTAGQMDYTAEVKYGNAVELNVTAEKEGWTHVGWSTSPNSTTVLTTAPKIGAADMILYAVYKKNITAAYIDRDDTGIQTRSETKTIYNREEGIQVILPEQIVWTEQKTGMNWEAEGWCPVENGEGELPDAETPATVMAKTAMFLKNDTSFYGRYSKKVTVSYDTNGSLEEIPEETKIRYYNASGMYQNPFFVLADAPALSQNSFVCWTVLDTGGVGAEPMNEYAAGQTVEFTEDIMLTAKWDAHPQIEAYDRYFTLEEAQSGGITPMVLLEKVKGTDKEDGDLKNGTDVVVMNYRPEDFSGFTAEGSVSVTYRAMDSFGNTVTKTVMVHISDLTPQEIQEKKYVRFISTRFYKDKDSYVTAEQGGLENASIWKQNPAYKAVLERTLNNKKINETVINTDFLEQEQGVVKPGSGTWEHEIQTWVFSKEEVQAVKDFLSENGLGNYQNEDGIEKFFQQISGDKG